MFAAAVDGVRAKFGRLPFRQHVNQPARREVVLNDGVGLEQDADPSQPSQSDNVAIFYPYWAVDRRGQLPVRAFQTPVSAATACFYAKQR